MISMIKVTLTNDMLKKISSIDENAKPSVYRIRVIHGCHGGTRIRNGIRDEFSYGREPKVKRITMGDNQGITELVLREFKNKQHLRKKCYCCK